MIENKNPIVIVNADDFGMSHGVNSAIVQSFKNNWISSATIMCTMPGFEEACNLIAEYNLHGKIGIHFNLSEGKPLTEKILKFPNFCNEAGLMYKSFKGHFLTGEERTAVIEELQAQLDTLTGYGIIPTHADTHHHMHHFMGIGNALVSLVKKNNIPAVRLRFNWGKLSASRRFYSAVFNSMLRFAGVAKTTYFCEIRSVTEELFRKKKPVEIMVHPFPGKDGKIVNYEGGNNFEELIEMYLPKIKFLSYADIT